MRPLPNSDLTYDAGQLAEISAGRTLLINAPVSGTPQSSVEWSLSNGNTLRPGESSGRFSVTENGALRIVRVRSTDSGAYQLRAANVIGEATRTTTVAVYGAPVITQSLRDSIAVAGVPVAVDDSGVAVVGAGLTLSMEGGAGGTPQPVGRFLKDGQVVTTGGRYIVETTPSGTLRLTVQNVEVGDSGAYAFIAESPGGAETTEISLTVERK